MLRLLPPMVGRCRLSPAVAYGALILLVALAVYSGGWDNDFLGNWDDPEYVTANPDIQAFSLVNLQTIFSSYYLNFYSPVHVLSYMLDYALWGLNPRGFLLVNVLLHGLNAIIFYRILLRLGVSAAGALCAALLFTVHPIQVESVAWISQRKSVLSLAFLLAAFWQYLDYCEAQSGRWRHFAWSLGLFLLALLTKLVVVILPAILLSYDLLLRDRGRAWLALLAEKVPYALLGFGVAWHAIMDGGNPAPALVGGSVAAEVMTMLTVYQRYLVNLFWPLRLSAEYQVDIKQALDAEVVTAAVLLVLSCGVVLLVGRRLRRGAAFCLAIFLIGLLPVAQIVPFIHLMYDRYLYIPLLGVAAGMAVLLDSCVARFRLPARPLLCGAGLLLLLLAGLSWQRTGVWADSVTLWQDAVTKQPGAAKAWEGLGQSYDHAGDYRSAVSAYQRALSLAPSDHEIYYKIGTALLNAGDLTPAEQHFRRALELNPGDDKVLYNLGYTYMLAGQYQAAVEALEQGIRRDPAALDMLVFLGANYYCLGNLPAARRAYEQVRQGPAGSGFSGMASGQLALVALRQGDEAGSRRLWQEALASGLSESEIYLNWARLEALGQHREEALRFLAAALSRGGDRSGLSGDPTFRHLYQDADFRRMVRP